MSSSQHVRRARLFSRNFQRRKKKMDLKGDTHTHREGWVHPLSAYISRMKEKKSVSYVVRDNGRCMVHADGEPIEHEKCTQYIYSYMLNDEKNEPSKRGVPRGEQPKRAHT